jgi:hypothetical protein
MFFKAIHRAVVYGCLTIAGLVSHAYATEATIKPEVVQLPLSFSNMYLIKSAKPILIDGGSPSDMPALSQDLQLKDAALVVPTHSHSPFPLRIL